MKKARLLLKRYLAAIKGSPSYTKNLLSLLRNCKLSFLKKEVAKIILKRTDLTPSAFYDIISAVPSFRLRAWRRLKQLSTADIAVALVDIIREVPSLRKQAFERLIKPDPCSNRSLLGIMYCNTPAALWAWRVFEHNPFSREELLDVVQYGQSRVVGCYAWERYVQIHPTQGELEAILDGSGKMKKEAAVLLVEICAAGKKSCRTCLLSLYEKLKNDWKEFRPILETIREMLETYEGDNRVYRALSETAANMSSKELYLDKIRFNKPTRDDMVFVIQTSSMPVKRMAVATELLTMRPLLKHINALLDSEEMFDLIHKYLNGLKKIDSELLKSIDTKLATNNWTVGLKQKHSTDADYLYASLIRLD